MEITGNRLLTTFTILLVQDRVEEADTAIDTQPI